MLVWSDECCGFSSISMSSDWVYWPLGSEEPKYDQGQTSGPKVTEVKGTNSVQTPSRCGTFMCGERLKVLWWKSSKSSHGSGPESVESSHVMICPPWKVDPSMTNLPHEHRHTWTTHVESKDSAHNEAQLQCRCIRQIWAQSQSECEAPTCASVTVVEPWSHLLQETTSAPTTKL